MIKYNPDVGMSFEECYNKHSGVMYLTCMRFNRKQKIKEKGLEFDDLIGQGKIGFIKAYEKYSSSKGKAFTTYMGHTVLGYLKNLYFLMDGSGLHYADHVKRKDIYREEKVAGSERLVFLDAKSVLADGETTNHDVISNSKVNDDSYIACEEIFSLLSNEQQMIVKWLQEEKTGAEIGNMMDISRQAVNIKLKKIQTTIASYYQKTENVDLTKVYVGRTNAGRKFKAIDEKGNIYYGNNFTKFAKEHNLHTSEIRRSVKTKTKYKGWKFEFVE